MKREEIVTLLPHRPPMLLLDEVVEQDGEAIGHYTVRGDEFFLQGHFPGNPIVPGVILCEMQDHLQAGQLPVYTGLNNTKFRASVRPGETVETRCHIRRAKHPFYFAEGTVRVGERLCMSTEFSFAITDGMEA